MKNFLLILLFAPLCSFKDACFLNSDAIIGKWMSEENNLEVEVFKSGNEYNAKVIWFDDSDDKSNPMMVRCDIKNPDKRLATRKIIGTQVMQGLHYYPGESEWMDGTIYDCSSGKYYNAKAWINKDGLLKVRGYWHFSLFGQTMNFKKI